MADKIVRLVSAGVDMTDGTKVLRCCLKTKSDDPKNELCASAIWKDSSRWISLVDIIATTCQLLPRKRWTTSKLLHLLGIGSR